MGVVLENPFTGLDVLRRPVAAAEFKTKQARASQRFLVLMRVHITEVAKLAFEIVVNVPYGVVNGFRRNRCAIQTRGSQRHERPAAARKVAVVGARMIAPASLLSLVLP